MRNCAYLLKEPATTLRKTAAIIPKSLRGRTYNTYCIRAQREWNKQPSYLFDEWVAYTNGSIARRTLGIQNRCETTQYMLEMAIYSTCVPCTIDSKDENLKAFLRWMWERSMFLQEIDSPLVKLRTNSDTSELRDFMRDYFGKEWTRETLGF